VWYFRQALDVPYAHFVSRLYLWYLPFFQGDLPVDIGLVPELRFFIPRSNFLDHLSPS
jgi:hypothetical protein